MNSKTQLIIISILILLPINLKASFASVIGGSFKCGGFKCPNGNVCEIVQTPKDDLKSVNISFQCRTDEGDVLQEESLTEVLPYGQIPIRSIIRKSWGEYGSGIDDGELFLPSFHFNLSSIFQMGKYLYKSTNDFIRDVFSDFNDIRVKNR